MRLNIIPVHDTSRNCVEDIFFSLANWLDKDTRFVYALGWDFEYFPVSENEKDILLGDRVGCGDSRATSTSILFEKFCGIGIIPKSAKCYTEVLDVIKESLLIDLPVFVHIDLYWCPWSKEMFKLYHRDHCFLAVGLNENSVICVDPAISAREVELPFEYLEKGVRGYALLNIKDVEEKYSWENAIGISIENVEKKVEGYNKLDLIRRFSQDMRNHMDLKKSLRALRGVYG